jgi:parvulin-like peptidyl-prolyl isomerase
MAWTINGEAIDEAAVRAEMDKLRPRYEPVFAEMPAEAREAQLAEWSRENLIEGILLRQAARREFQSTPPEAIEDAWKHFVGQAGGMAGCLQRMGLSSGQEATAREQFVDRLHMERLTQRVAAAVPAPADKEILRHFEKHRERYTIPEMVRARHIVKHPKTEGDADAIRVQMQAISDELAGGKADFAALAEKHSDCPDNGGELGFFPRGQMVPEFEDVVFALKPGGISGVFETRFGFHIAQVTERREAVPCSLSQVREAIVRELQEQARQKALEKFIDGEKAKAVIEER